MKNPFLLLFPPRCAICGKIISHCGGYVCAECWDRLPRIEEPRCFVCGAPLGSNFAMAECSDCRAGVPYEKCFVPFQYKDGIRKAVARMKYSRRPSAFRYFAKEIAVEIGGLRTDFITFVPQNRKTRRQRGYNQTELIAEELGRLLDIPVISALIRSEQGEKQVTLSRSRRINNAKRLFFPKNIQLSGSCIIVDDVITTGSTIKTCCKILKSMGCEHVYAAAVARTVL